MTEVTEVQLPGVGVRHEFTTTAGERIAVVTLRTGRREIAVYDRADPDSCTTTLRLAPADARTMAELLGGDPVSEALAAVHQLEGVAIDWIRLDPEEPRSGETIGASQLRTRTGASVVAIIRDDETVPDPGPDTILSAGDVVVAIGAVDGLQRLRSLLGA